MISYTDDDLSMLIDSIIDAMDINKDGYITFYEYKLAPDFSINNTDGELSIENVENEI